MPGADSVRYMCKAKGITIRELSEMLDCPYQSLKNKQHRDTYPFREVEHIADLLGFDIVAVQRKGDPVEDEA